MADEACSFRVLVQTAPILLAGIRAALAAHGSEVTICARDEEPDLVLVDVEHLAGWVAPRPRAPVVVLALEPHQAPDIIEHAVLGELRVLPCDISPSLLAKTLLSIMDTSDGALQFPAAPRHAGPALSPREVEVLTLIIAGLSNVEIADRLFLSVNSIKSHIRTLYRKIGAERRPQAVIWGMSQGYDRPSTRPSIRDWGRIGQDPSEDVEQL